MVTGTENVSSHSTTRSIAENLGDTRATSTTVDRTSGLAISASTTNSEPSPPSASVPSACPPPPPYSPRILVSDDGSPVAKSKFVDIAIDLRWPDKFKKETVERGKPESELKRLTPVKNLLGFTINPDVQISPPESAKSITKIHVDSNYNDFLSAITADVEQRLQEKNERRERKLIEDLQARFESCVDFEKDFTRFLWMRIIQDQVYTRMSESLHPGSEPKEWATFAELVQDYEQAYEIDVLTQNDLMHLRNATDRETANQLIHPSFTDREAIRKSWTGLEARLRGDGLEDLRSRYERFYMFATGLAV